MNYSTDQKGFASLAIMVVVAAGLMTSGYAVYQATEESRNESMGAATSTVETSADNDSSFSFRGMLDLFTGNDNDDESEVRATSTTEVDAHSDTDTNTDARVNINSDVNLGL